MGRSLTIRTVKMARALIKISPEAAERLGGCASHKQDIRFFCEEDGTTMEVIFTKVGPRKARWIQNG